MKNSKSVNIPSLSEIDPTYTELEKKKNDLIADQSKDQKQVDDIFSELLENGRSPAQRERDNRIARLIDDATVEIPPDGRAQIPALNQRIEDRRLAIEVLNGKLDSERLVASKMICQRIGPEHSRRVVAMCRALIDLRDAMANYEQLVSELQSQDVAWTTLHPMQILFAGRPNDPQDRIGQYLREAEKFGFIEKSSIPPELKSHDTRESSWRKTANI
jgi:hypothetical protein